MHAIFYMRMDDGDIIHHRFASAGSSWSTPEPLGHNKERNWGPDLVVRDDGSVVVVYDHALKDFSSVGYISTYTDGKLVRTRGPDTNGKKRSRFRTHTMETMMSWCICLLENNWGLNIISSTISVV